jgi:multisubunit Na+/H+ antiporter MnhE subunit
MAAHSKGFDFRAALISSVEFFFLLGLWMIFVSMAKIDELLVGVAACLISAFADGVVKAKKFATFYPHLKSILLVFWEPWYALSGTAAIFVALARHLIGKKSEAQLRAIAFDAGADDPTSAARRALAIMYTTIPPNFVVVGIDRDKKLMLVHQVSPTGTPLIAQRLGAKA